MMAKRFWKATLKDGSMVSELSHDWDDVKDDAISLCLCFDERWYFLPDNMDAYIQSKTVSCPIGGGVCNIVSRNIGFIHGNSEYILRVSEKNGDVNVEFLETEN